MKPLLYLLLACLMWTETQAAILQITSPQAAGTTFSASAGDTVTIRISIDTEGTRIQGVEAFITLPDSVFEVVDAFPSQSGVQPFRRGGFINGSVIFNRLSAFFGQEPSNNRLDYSEIRQGEGNRSGKGIVATCRLVALRSAENFSISIDRQFPLRETKYLISDQDQEFFFRQHIPLRGTVVGFPILDLPDIRVAINGEDRSLDLDAYVEHATLPDEDLTWTAQGFDTALISVSIDAITHAVTFRSIGSQSGQTTVTFTATDSSGKSGSARLALTVTSGPKLLLPNNFSFTRNTSLQIGLDQYVEDADNLPNDLLWDISEGDRISVQHNGRNLTLTASEGWVGVETFTFTVTDPEGAQDQKFVTISVTADTPPPGNGGNGGNNGGNGGNNGENTPPPDQEVLSGMVGIWESARGDTLLYADLGDTLSLDIQANVGTERANGFELFIAIDSRYIAPIDQGAATGIQPFISHAKLPESSVWINTVLTTSDTTHTYLRYAEVSLAGTTTDTATVATLQLIITSSIPAETPAFIAIETDTLNQRKTSFTVQGTGENFTLIPRNQIQIQNRLPILHVPRNLSVFEDETLILDLNGLVEDRMFTAAEFTWVITAPDTSLNIMLIQEANDQRVILRPPLDRTGIFTLIFWATDPEGVRVWQPSELTVVSVNDKPVLAGAFTLPVVFDEDMNFVASLDTLATDPDHLPWELGWTAQNGQTVSATIDMETRLLRIVPPPDWYGQDTIAVTVTDPKQASTQAQVVVSVRPINDSPTFISPLPELTIAEGDTVLDLNAYVKDADDATETFLWEVFGAREIGSKIESGGLLTLSIPAGWTGTETLTIKVRDTHGASTEAPLQVSAKPKLTGDFTGNGSVGFDDFLLFAQQFGNRAGNPAFDSKFDIDGNGEVGFGDFIAFAAFFGKEQ